MDVGTVHKTPAAGLKIDEQPGVRAGLLVYWLDENIGGSVDMPNDFDKEIR